MFQKCPVCNGTGTDPNSINMNACTVCKGTKIISELTGTPPIPKPMDNPNINLEYPGNK